MQYLNKRIEVSFYLTNTEIHKKSEISNVSNVSGCPDKNYTKNACSVLENCEIGEFCYRDIPISSNETKNMYGCCSEYLIV